MSERVEELIAQMSLDEKAAMTAGVDMWHGTGNERLGVRGIKVTDGPNGARGNSWTDTTSACTPCGTALGSTWNADLVREVGEVLGQETRSKGADLLLAPTVNLHRSPLAGRNFECWSEDPLLTARLAVAYIDGVQSQGVGCSIKHFVANDSEFERHTISSEVDERTLRELYLLPFEHAVRDADVASVMTAYNRLGGTYCAEHPDLVARLDEWGFGGFVISDWWGTKSTAGTGRHGVALEMPGPPAFLGPALADAVRAGEVDEAHVDTKLRALLGVMERLGALDDTRDPDAERSHDDPAHRAVLRRAAREAVVLLRNETLPEGRPTLPIPPSTVRRVAVIGPCADVHLVQGGGSAAVNPHHDVTILDGLRARYGDDVEVTYHRGCDAYRNLPPLDHRWIDGGRFTVEYFAGRDLTGEPVATATTAVPRFSWLGDPRPGVTAGDWSARITGTFVAPAAGPFELSAISAGPGRLRADGEVIVDLWDHREPGDAFFGLGSAEVRARLDLTAGQRVELEAEVTCIEGFGAAGFLVGGLPVLPADPVSEAAALAADADAAIVVVGLNQDWESEGADRAHWHLPGRQVELLEAVAAAQDRTVVLVQAGSPVAMHWEEQVGAVAQIWYLGQEGGDAVADLISGDHSPSGRLPTSLPLRFEDHPALANYPGEFGQVRYGEGLFMGYRSYDQRQLDVRHPFGFGLGYSTFVLSGLTATTAGGTVNVSVRVANTGAHDASETVQVYVAPLDSPVARPPQELKGFAKAEVAAGAHVDVTLHLDERAFQHWDPVAGAWARSGDRFEIRVGTSSRDLPLSAAVQLDVMPRSGPPIPQSPAGA